MATLHLAGRAPDAARTAPTEQKPAEPTEAPTKPTMSIGLEAWAAMTWADRRDLLRGVGFSRELVRRILNAEGRAAASEKFGSPLPQLPALAAGTVATVTSGNLTVTISACGNVCPRSTAKSGA